MTSVQYDSSLGHTFFKLQYASGVNPADTNCELTFPHIYFVASIWKIFAEKIFRNGMLVIYSPL
jgi:hypothetical protein